MQLLEIFITEKREKDKICVLSKGEVEYYLPEGYKKLNTLIELTKNERKFRDLIIREDYREKRVELSKIICFILGINLLPDEEVVGILAIARFLTTRASRTINKPAPAILIEWRSPQPTYQSPPQW